MPANLKPAAITKTPAKISRATSTAIVLVIKYLPFKSQPRTFQLPDSRQLGPKSDVALPAFTL
jgi:hypothetical protein